MIITLSYLWAVVQGGVPFGSDFMFGTVVADIIIVAMIASSLDSDD